MDSFSRRQGYSRPEVEISIRHKAPESLRVAIVSIAYRCGFASSELCLGLCCILYKTPDKCNWSEYSNNDDEVGIWIDKLEWFDFVEHLTEKSLCTTAAYEQHKALQDLSCTPQLEISGAIQHAMAALECVARDVIGNKDTQGQLIQRNPGLFPKPVDQIVEKAWTYSSNFGRHLIEKKFPEFEEAELMLGVSGVLCRYLARRTGNST
ncbi:hypothetical protein OTJ42_21695 [Citrobacter braakii]|uniref:AbiJ-NTD4 domain-containing protein n=1 Tax=Citrobacter braakii TaxID=57706 RepID=UPI00227ED47A|nr:hypothetical protein [Citrobacter braakii]MCY9801052.1 hypothetical protein [Citrobacter braakii]